MKMKFSKSLLVSAKIVIAVVLLGWVISQVHWRDYVIVRDGLNDAGKVYAVLDGDSPQKLVVAGGILWWQSEPAERPATDFLQIPGSSMVIRKGFYSSLVGIRVAILICAMVGLAVAVLIMSCRLWYLLRAQDIPIGPWEVVRLTFLGYFFNFVVPGTVGGDLIKAYHIAKHTPKKASVLVSIFVDRMMGLAVLAMIGAITIAVVIVLGIEQFENVREAVIVVAVVISAFICGMVFLLSSGFRRIFHLQKLYRRLPIAGHISVASEAAEILRRRPAVLGGAGLITFATHIVWIGSIALMGQSLSLAIPWYDYFLYIPLIYIIAAVPISPGGVGLVEKFYVVFFVAGAVGPSEILALALLARVGQMFWGLPGAVVAVTGAKVPKTDEVQAELGLD